MQTHHALSTTPDLPTFPAAAPELPSVLVSIQIIDSTAVFSERGNSSQGVVDFDPLDIRFLARPIVRGHSLPYIYRVRFEAENFRFAAPAENAVIWRSPEERPPWIAEPKLSDDATLIDFLVVNSTFDRQAAIFDLVSATKTGTLIDPTIVNNPDGGP